MIRRIITFINDSFEGKKRKHNGVNDTILKSALIYQLLHLTVLNEYITIDEVLELNNNEIGLIGPGNGCLTWFLEIILGQFDVMRTHGILHDAFGRFYANHHAYRGYTYAISKKITPKCVKRSPLCGHISGLIYCVFNKIKI